MKISRIEIKHFKSIGNKLTLQLHPHFTVLVGKSNVGKSNVLDAITFGFESSKRLANTFKCSWSNPESWDVCIEIHFDIHTKDKLKLKRINTQLANRKQIRLRKYVNGNQEIEVIPDVQPTLKQLPDDNEFIVNTLSGFRRRLRRMFRQWESIDHLQYKDTKNIGLDKRYSELMLMVNDNKILDVQPTQQSMHRSLIRVQKSLALIRKKLNLFSKEYGIDTRGIKQSTTYLIADIGSVIPKVTYSEVEVAPYEAEDLKQLLPTVVYLKGTDKLDTKDKVYVSEIDGAQGNTFIKKIIALAQLNIDEIKIDDRRINTEALRKANDNLKTFLSNYWNQEDLLVELQVGKETKGNRTVKYLELDVIGIEGHRGSLQSQSEGTRYFISLVVNHILNIESNKDIILIMDEPGMHLHAAAQKDLLEMFANVPTNIQLLYTTHSPFLINKNYPQRIKSIEKSAQGKSSRGTSINDKPYHSRSGNAWEPIRTAIGLSAGASLFVGSSNLIVEGIADEYILSGVITALSRFENSKHNLNKVTINFGGDPSNTVALALFCHQETKSTKVLLDSDTGGDTRKRLTKSNKFPRTRIFLYKEILGDDKYIEIEDLFSYQFYHDCFLEAYAKLPDYGKDKLKKLPKTWGKLKTALSGEEGLDGIGRTKYYHRFFSKDKSLGGFSKVIVAKEIAEKLQVLNQGSVERTIKPFKPLLKTIWEQDPKW